MVTLQSDLTCLDPYQRLKIIVELSKFVLPILRAVELDANDSQNFKPLEIVVKYSEVIKPLE